MGGDEGSVTMMTVDDYDTICIAPHRHLWRHPSHPLAAAAAAVIITRHQQQQQQQQQQREFTILLLLFFFSSSSSSSLFVLNHNKTK